MKLIGLSGYARTGKDTVANILQDQHGFTRVSFAAALKDMAERINPLVEMDFVLNDYGYAPLSDALKVYGGWERTKDEVPTVREFLQNLGVAAREVIDPDVWVKTAMKNVNWPGKFVIPDVRFPNELGAIRFRQGVSVRIERPGYGPVNGHQSETALDDALFDYTLSNDGTVTKLERWCAALVAELDQREEELELLS